MKKFRENYQQRLTARHKYSMELTNVKNKVILDVGCAFGWFEKYAIENGCKKIYGIDIDGRQININKKDYISKKSVFLKKSVFELSVFLDESFDLITCFEVIEHINKGFEDKLFSEFNRLLKRGGYLIISTPRLSFWSCVLDPAWYFGHRHYSEKELMLITKQNNFEIELIKIKGGFWELFSMLLFYFFKLVFNKEIPFKYFFDKKRNKEYKEEGFITMFIKLKKIK